MLRYKKSFIFLSLLYIYILFVLKIKLEYLNIEAHYINFESFMNIVFLNFNYIESIGLSRFDIIIIFNFIVLVLTISNVLMESIVEGNKYYGMIFNRYKNYKMVVREMIKDVSLTSLYLIILVASLSGVATLFMDSNVMADVSIYIKGLLYFGKICILFSLISSCVSMTIIKSGGSKAYLMFFTTIIILLVLDFSIESLSLIVFSNSYFIELRNIFLYSIMLYGVYKNSMITFKKGDIL